MDYTTDEKLVNVALNSRKWKGNLVIGASDVYRFDKLEQLDGSLIINNYNFKSFGSLKMVTGSISFGQRSSIKDTENLVYVGMGFSAKNSTIAEISPALKYIGGSLILTRCKHIKSLNNDLMITGALWVSFTNIKEIGSNITIEKKKIHCFDTPYLDKDLILEKYPNYKLMY